MNQESDSQLLIEDVVTDEGSVKLLIDQRNSDSSNHRPPGPGIIEAFFWIFLFFGLQLAAMFVVLIAAYINENGSIAGVEKIDMGEWIQSFDLTTKLIVFTSPAFLCYLILVPFGLLRLAPRPVSRLNLSLPTFGQVIVAASLVLPLTMLADASMKMLVPQWERLVELVPAFEFLNQSDVHKVIGEFGGASFILSLFFIAVVPAFGEEFLFRGLLGRGLVARWGLIGGVGITSFLFAAVHMYPPHVLAIIPVGIALHWIYLTTKSFWAPVLFHFLNNGIAVILMRANQGEGDAPWFVIPIAVLYFAWALFWLFKMRTVHQIEGANYQSPGNTVEVPEDIRTTRYSKTYLLPVIVAFVMLLIEISAIYSTFYPE